MARRACPHCGFPRGPGLWPKCVMADEPLAALLRSEFEYLKKNHPADALEYLCELEKLIDRAITALSGAERRAEGQPTAGRNVDHSNADSPCRTSRRRTAMSREQTERDAIAAAEENDHRARKMLREAGQEIRDACHDHLDTAEPAFLEICALSESDPNEAGIRLREWVRDAAHASARWSLGDTDKELVPPKRIADVDVLKMVGNICRPARYESENFPVVKP